MQWGGVLFEWIVFILGLKRRHTKCLRKVPKEFQIWPGPTSINYEGRIVFHGSMPEPTSKLKQHIDVFSSFCIFVFKFLWRRKKDKCILWKTLLATTVDSLMSKVQLGIFTSLSIYFLDQYKNFINVGSLFMDNIVQGYRGCKLQNCWINLAMVYKHIWG